VSRLGTILGTVQDVSGATVSISLDESTATGLAFVEGEGYRVGQVGSFVRIPVGFVDLFGVVSHVGAGALPDRLQQAHPYGHRWIRAQLAGESVHGGQFKRGVSQYPTIGDPVHLVTERDLSRIYAPQSPAGYIKIGNIASSESIPALIDVNRFVSRHAAIVGATGSGKSTTVAALLRALSEPTHFPAARIVVLDIHGEYASALADRAAIFRTSPCPGGSELSLHLPYWALSFDELVGVTLGALEGANLAIVQDRLLRLKLAALPPAAASAERVTVDTPIPFSIHQLWYDLHCEMNATHRELPGRPQSRETWALSKGTDGQDLIGDPGRAVPPTFLPIKDVAADTEKIRLSKSALSIRRQVDALGAKLRDSRFSFLFNPGPWSPNLAGSVAADLDALLSQWLGADNPIAVLDLSGVPSAVLSELVGALLRILYDAVFWGRYLPEGGRDRPLLLVLEEAHAYLATGSNGPAASAVRRIAREGRKYGVGLVVVSQRPSEVDSTILSQCGTMIAMRLSNASDRSHVTSVASDNLEGLFAMLPVLRTGEALVVGEAVSIPMRVMVDPPPLHKRPDSKDPKVVVRTEVRDAHGRPSGWNSTMPGKDYRQLAESWRWQDPKGSGPQDLVADPGDDPRLEGK